MKEDVKLNGIQREIQKDFVKEFTEIKEGISKIMKSIQDNIEDMYIGWMMKKKRVRWYALQQKERQHSLAWRKDKELKKDERVQRLIKQEQVHSCEHEVGIFLMKTDEVDIKPKENAMEYSGSESHPKELMMK